MTSMSTLPAIKILAETMQVRRVSRKELADRLSLPITVVADWLDGRMEIGLLDLAKALDALDESPSRVGRSLCALLDVRMGAA